MDSNFLQKKFSEYYAKNSVAEPPQVDRREFGAGNDKKITFRHLAFQDANAMNTYIRTSTPLFISYSAGYYEFPAGRPMKKKNWQGADLVFDFDADEFETPCEHSGEMVCEVCMDRVKKEVIHLVEDFLVPDFGFSKSEIATVFSGNRGYHLHMREEKVHPLTSNARKGIVDYITTNRFSPQFRRDGKSLVGPSPEAGGWAGRTVASFLQAVETMPQNELAKALGVSPATAGKIVKSRDDIINGVKRGSWSAVALKEQTWEKALKMFASKNEVIVDRNVTLDVSRLMRLPTSLHGGTGFKAVIVNNIESFDPFKDPVVFGKDPVEVKVVKSSDFELCDELFSLGEGKEIVLPEFAAVFAAGKGLVEVK